ncbi:oligosaccharide flippase family protein [Pseudomonadales bacterium]|nr:oligosaccharide flippase family protein [Pseudomonadales bacterium]
MIRYHAFQALQFLKSHISLTKAHSYFMGSAAIVQLIPLITAPIIARLYSPADFGAYAIFVGLVAIVSTVAQLALHESILLESDDSNAAVAHLLSVLISVMTAITVQAVVVWMPETVVNHYFGPGIVDLLPWLPASIFISGLYGCFYTWWIRQGLYLGLARNKLILGISTAFIQIGIGAVGLDAIGFVWANLLGMTLATLLLVNVVLKDMNSIDHKFSLLRAWNSFVKHKKLVVFTMPAGLVNSVAAYLPSYFINFFFGVSALGQYSLATRMVDMPLSFLSVSVQDIFRQEASQEFNKKGVCEASFNKFFLLMLFAAVFLVVPLVLILPYIFPIFFGDQWLEAGFIIQPMILLIAIRFISSPLSYVWIIRGYQGLDLLWQLGLLFCTLCSFLIPTYFAEDVSLETVLWTYSASCALWYSFCILQSRRFSLKAKNVQL